MALGSNTFMESNALRANLLGTPDLSCGSVAFGARYSALEPSNGPHQGSTFANLIALAPNSAARAAIVNGGREEDVTVGLNWYPDDGVRIMANWTRVTRLAAPWNRPYLGGAHPSTFLLRTQIMW